MEATQHARSEQQDQVRDWFRKRTYRSEAFSDTGLLLDRKQQLELTLTVVLPTREVARTIGPIIDEINLLNERAALVDQIVVVDAGSSDGTAEVAREHGAEVFQERELMPAWGKGMGKGDAMWRALSVASGELVAYLDSDTTDFGRHFVCGLLGAYLAEPDLRFVKATYNRPFKAPDGTLLDDAGRVTELTAKPLFAAFRPELCGFGQPLSGELIASRELLCSIPFLTGYAVETAMMIDVLDRVGLDAMAQVDLGTRHNRYQSLFALGAMAYSVLRAVALRAGEGSADLLADLPAELPAELPDAYLSAVCLPDGVRLAERSVEIVERPPMAEAA